MNLSPLTSTEKWESFESIAAELYPSGPNDNELWERAGGRNADLRWDGNGRSRWHAALVHIRQGGRALEIEHLLDEMSKDFPMNVSELRFLAREYEFERGCQLVSGFAKAQAVVAAVSANYARGGVNSLPEAVLNDARDLVAVLAAPRSIAGYDPKRIQTLLDSEATLAAMREALAKLAAVSGEDDTVLIYFSGHGARLEVEGVDTSVLLPVDCRHRDLSATTLSEAEFSKALGAISAKRLVVILDACHSGGAGSVKGAVSTGLQEGFDEKSLQRLAQGTGRVIIASSRATETSLVLSGSRNSVFTSRLLEALRGHGETRGDGLIRVFEIFNYVSEKVRTTVPGRQHPIFKAGNLEDNFPVALEKGGGKRVSEAAPERPTLSRTIEGVMADLYPVGPVDQEIWARAGGDISRLHLHGTGRTQWFSALKMLGLGGGGRDISTESLVRTALDDFPHHPDLQALTMKSR